MELNEHQRWSFRKLQDKINKTGAILTGYQAYKNTENKK